YGNLIAVIQIIGGLLVTQRRFALAGALLLLPVTLNIILVDMFYGIGIGPMLTAVLLLGLLVRIVAPHARPILDAVVPSHTRGNAKVSTFIAPLALVIAAFGFTYWVANYNNRVPTAIDGVWTVQAAAGADSLERAFFERNRAHMVVLKDASGVYRQHHFELEPDGRLRIWETWLTKGPSQYEGMFTPPDRIRLHRAAESGDGIVELQRLPHAWRVEIG